MPDSNILQSVQGQIMSLSKKADFGDDSEIYFWFLSKKQPCCCTLEHALGFSKLSCQASEIKD
jgi:hypothetical protein